MERNKTHPCDFADYYGNIIRLFLKQQLERKEDSYFFSAPGQTLSSQDLLRSM